MVSKALRQGTSKPIGGYRRIAALGLVFLGVMVACPGAVRAVTCTAAVDRHQVASGDRITLTVTIEGAFQTAPPVDLPPLDGVDIYSGGTSQSYSFVNGRVSASVTTTYFLEVLRDTSFTIPALTVAIDGRSYQTQPIPITVERGQGGHSPPPLPAGGSAAGGSKAGGSAGPGNAPASPPASAPGNLSSGGRAGDEVFITLATDKTGAYVGEQVVLVFRFHRRVQLWDNPQYTAPRSEGFWREDLGPERSYVQTIGGYSYQVTEIRYALFPTRPGTLVIGPAEVNFAADLFNRFFSFRNRRTAGPQRLRTQSIRVEVWPLPTPQPGNFSGVVAEQLSLAVSLDRTTVPRGEPVSLKVELTADGFLQSLRQLPLTMPPAVRMHDAGESLSTDKSGEKLLSRYQVEKVLVPSEEGTLQLDPVVVTYFDPAAKQYRTARRDGPQVEVTASDLPVAGDAPETLLRGAIERLGQDLAFIHGVTGRLGTRARPLLTTPLWWLAALLPLLGLLVLRGVLGRAEQERRDPLGVRRRRALPRARRTLQAASRQQEYVAALSGLARAITGYVADRTGRPPAAVGADEVQAFAADLGEPEHGRRLAELLGLCDSERFDPFTPSDDGERPQRVAPFALLAEAGDLLATLEKRAARGQHAGTQAVTSALLLLFLVAGTAGLAGAQSATTPSGRGPDPLRLLAEGNQAYTAGDNVTALTCYREALATGVHDPVLFYNLGNAYARQGELGRAILYYLRAQRLAPRDRDVQANLTWLRSLLHDQELAPGRLPLLLAPLFGLVRFFSLDEWSLALLAVVWLLCVLLGWSWYRGGASDNLRRLLLGGSGLLVLLMATVALLWYEEEVQDQAVVVVPEVEVRSGPATTFPVVFRIHDGLTLTVRGQREDWLRIGLGGEWVGWVPTGSVENVRPSRTSPLAPASGGTGRESGEA
jgi:tetratricopeptide (TPR) repeat protein